MDKQEKFWILVRLSNAGDKGVDIVKLFFEEKQDFFTKDFNKFFNYFRDLEKEGLIKQKPDQGTIFLLEATL